MEARSECSDAFVARISVGARPGESTPVRRDRLVSQAGRRTSVGMRTVARLSGSRLCCSTQRILMDEAL